MVTPGWLLALVTTGYWSLSKRQASVTVNGVRAAATAPAAESTALVKPLDHDDLRILPLGDSITYGLRSTNHDGYRDVLFNDLIGGNVVDLIGSQHYGSMADNANEGHSGYRISQIADIANLSLQANPNVVLLHAGTNDCIQDFALPTAPQRLGALMDQILSIVPQTTLLVAQIIGTPNATVQARIDVFNAQVPGLVDQRASTGARVWMVNMSHLLDTHTDYAGEWHPNDQGYALMANAWYLGLEEANAKGLIHNATAGNVSATQNPTATAHLPAQLFGAALTSYLRSNTAARSTMRSATGSATAAGTAPPTATSSAGAHRIAALPTGGLFELPGPLAWMTATIMRQQW